MIAVPPTPATRRPDGAAIAVEAILAIFGFYGVGWLMSGKTLVGALLLGGGMIWMIVAIIGTIITAGIGACCLLPVHLAFITLSTVLLANQQIPAH